MINSIRLWSEYYKEYVDWYDGVMFDCDGKMYYNDGVAGDGDIGIVYEWCTGIKDINDKYIFTGDIIKTKAGRIQIVKQGVLSSDENNIISGFYAEDIKSGDPYTFSSHDEVIGNVHDNAKLLGEE